MAQNQKGLHMIFTSPPNDLKENPYPEEFVKGSKVWIKGSGSRVYTVKESPSYGFKATEGVKDWFVKLETDSSDHFYMKCKDLKLV